MATKTIKKNKIPNLEQMLELLGSDEARAKLIATLIEKGKEVPKTYLNKAVDLYEKAGRFHDAADVAKEAGLTERAIDVYEKAGYFGDAAAVAEKAGLTERATFYNTLERLLR